MQHDFEIANQSGANFRADLNNALAAIVSNSSGPTEPATTVAYQFWVDTSQASPVLKMRNEANDGWVVIAQVDLENMGYLSTTGGTLSGPLDFSNTDAMTLPTGTTAQRPSVGAEGMIRYNSQTLQFEGYKSGAWSALGSGGGSGSSSSVAFADLASDRIARERLGQQVDLIYDAQFNSFARQTTATHYLMDDATAGATSIKLIQNPLYPADTLTEATTGWSVGQSAATITASTTRKLGATSVAFNKGTASATAHVSRTTSLNLRNNYVHYFWVYLPDLTGFVCAYVLLGKDASNWASYPVTTRDTGAAFAVGWNLCKIDLSTATPAASGNNAATAGTSWTLSNGLNWYAIGVATNVAGQAYTGILVDGLFFADMTGLYIQPGDELTLWDATNKESIVVASSNTTVNGTVTLAAALTNSYSVLTGNVARSSLNVPGSGAAQFSTATGAAALSQEHRTRFVLSQPASASLIQAFADIESRSLKVTAVNAGVSIVVDSGGDLTTSYPTGSVFDVFAISTDSQGVLGAAQRTPTYTSTGTATYAAGTNAFGATTLMTIPMTTTTGIVAGDMIVRRSHDFQLGVRNSGNEAFTSQTPTRVDFNPRNVAIPSANYVWGYFDLNGNAKNKMPTGGVTGNAADGTMTGVVNYTNYFNGRLASGPYIGSNYFLIPRDTANSAAFLNPIAGNNVAISFWAYLPGLTGSLMGFNNGPSGWWFSGMSSNRIGIGYNSSSVGEVYIGAYTPNKWTHVCATFVYGTNGVNLYIDGVLKATGTYPAGVAAGDGNTNFMIGGHAALAQNSSAYFADLVIWRGIPTANLTSSFVAQMYNGGVPPLLAPGSSVRYNYAVASQTGSIVSAKTVLTKPNAADPLSLRALAVGRTS